MCQRKALVHPAIKAIAGITDRHVAAVDAQARQVSIENCARFFRRDASVKLLIY